MTNNGLVHVLVGVFLVICSPVILLGFLGSEFLKALDEAKS